MKKKLLVVKEKTRLSFKYRKMQDYGIVVQFKIASPFNKSLRKWPGGTVATL